MFSKRPWSPGMALLAAALGCFGLAFVVIFEALSVPWLGLGLRVDGYRGESVGNGLTSVRFRVRELGGTTSFEGTNAGTRVRVELPLSGVQLLGKLA